MALLCFTPGGHYLARDTTRREEMWLIRHMFPINVYWFADNVQPGENCMFYYDAELRRRPTTLTHPQYLPATLPRQAYPFYTFSGLITGVLGAFNLQAYTETYFTRVLVPWLDANYAWMSTQNIEWGDYALAQANPVYMCLPVAFKTSNGAYYTMTGASSAETVIHPFAEYAIMAFMDPVRYCKESIYVHVVRAMAHTRAAHLHATT